MSRLKLKKFDIKRRRASIMPPVKSERESTMNILERAASFVLAAVMTLMCASCGSVSEDSEESSAEPKHTSVEYYKGTDIPDFGAMYNVECDVETVDDVIMNLYGLSNTTDEDIASYETDIAEAGFVKEENAGGDRETIYKNSDGEELSVKYDDVNNLFIVGYYDTSK